MEFKFNVQGELFCNRDGFAVIQLSHLLREDYENTFIIKEVVNKLRSCLKKVIIHSSSSI